MLLNKKTRQNNKTVLKHFILEMQFYLLMDEHNEQKKAADLNKWATHRNEIISPASCSCCRDDPGYLLIYSDSVTEVKSIHDHPEVCNTNKTNAGRNTVNIKTTLIVLKQPKIFI